MNTYRVDRIHANSKTPCGMNSIVYMGDSEFRARQVLETEKPGYTPWNIKSEDHILALSKWDSNTREYQIILRVA